MNPKNGSPWPLPRKVYRKKQSGPLFLCAGDYCNMGILLIGIELLIPLQVSWRGCGGTILWLQRMFPPQYFYLLLSFLLDILPGKMYDEGQMPGRGEYPEGASKESRRRWKAAAQRGRTWPWSMRGQARSAFAGWPRYRPNEGAGESPARIRVVPRKFTPLHRKRQRGVFYLFRKAAQHEKFGIRNAEFGMMACCVKSVTYAAL